MLQECAVLLGLLICAEDVSAQSVSQSGSVTPGHAATWVTTGVIKDGGTASTPTSLTSIGTVGSGPTICAHSAASGAKNVVCLTATATAGGITMTNVGGGTGGFTFTLNGVVQGIATVTLPVTTNNAVCFADSTGTLKDCGGVPIFGLVVGTTTITGGTSGYLLFDNAGVLGETAGRETLAAARTYYVRTAGSDTNCSGLVNANDPGSGSLPRPCAFATLQKASNVVLYSLDLGNNTVTIDATGTFTSGFLCIGTPVGGGSIVLTSTSGATISTTSAHAVRATNGCVLTVQGNITITTTGTATDSVGLLADFGGRIAFKDVTFGATGSSQIQAGGFIAVGTPTTEAGNGSIEALGSYTIAGSSVSHLHATSAGAQIFFNSSVVITLTGTPNFSAYFVGISRGFVVFPIGVTFSGSATGRRYYVHRSGTLVVATASRTYLPGDAVGDVLTGGIYMDYADVFSDYAVSNSVAAEKSAPSTPAAGYGWWWSDSTDHRFHDINPSGVIGTTVVAITCSSQFVSAISAAGVATCATPTVGMLSLTNTHILVGNGSNVATDVAMSGDATIANTGALTLASVISAGGPTGSATVAPIITYDAKGRLTTVSSATITPAVGSITGLGTGVATALGVNIGTAGSVVVNGGALGSPSSAGTIPAFTLGGTVSGGGNQINNVIIGTSTPLAGAFTTVTASTSVTSPLIIGGTAASSTLTLESTSGAGTTDSIVLKTASQSTRATMLSNGNLGVGLETNPQVLVVFSNNTATGIASPATTMFQLRAVDASSATMVGDGFGVNGGFIIVGRGARNTAASPQAVQAGDSLMVFGGRGYDGSAYTAANNARLAFLAAETWSSGSATGAYITFETTPTGSTTRAEAVRVQPSGGLSIGTTTDPAIGGLQVNAKIYAPNLATTTAALAAALCWTATTGEFQRDTNAGGCLASSRRYKHDIHPLGDGLSIVMKTKPVSFFYNENTGIKGEQVGFIAEELGEVDPRLIGHDSDGRPNSVRYMQSTAILTRAIQQLKADNDNLRAEINALKQRRAK